MATRSLGRGRVRKQVPTTLGRAPSFSHTEPTDLAHVRTPIDTSVFGLKQVLTLLETATEEVRRYVAYECNIIYECRTCRSLFRSLANFILHKRSYCQEVYDPVHKSRKADLEDYSYEIASDTTNEDEVEEQLTKTTKKISDVLKKLTKKQESIKISEEIAHNELSPEEPNELHVDLKYKQNSNKVRLEKIEKSTVGVFQTIPNGLVGNDLMKSEVMEIHSILNNNEAILRPDGKAFAFHSEQDRSNPTKPKLVCSVCDLKFATKKTLTYHIKYKHNDTRLVYVCPECRDTFANAWCVFRHLYKVHRKTTAQIRKLRDIVHSTPIVWSQTGGVVKEKSWSDDVNNADRDNQWLNNLEGDMDLQMCGGCGKRFERKAALHSHSQTCMKRMVVCNSIRKTNGDRHNKQKPQNTACIKGAKRRKPNILRKMVKSGHKTEEEKSCNESDKELLAEIEMEKVEIEEVIFGNRESILLADKLEDEKSDPIIILHSDDEDTFGFPNENENNQNERNIETETTVNGNKDENIELHQTVANESGIENAIKTITLNVNPTESETVQRNESASVNLMPHEINDINNKLEDSNFNNIGVSWLQDEKLEEVNDCQDIFDDIDIDLDLIVNGISQKDPVIVVDLTEDCTAETIDANNVSTANNISDTTDISLTVSNTNRSETSTPPSIIDEPFEMLSPAQLTPTSSKKRKRTADEISLKSKSKEYVNWELLQCNSCNTSFQTDDCLMEHMALHFDWFRFQCGKCTFVSYNDKNCLTHLQTEHGVDPIISELCIVPLPNWKALKLSSEFKSLELAPPDADKSSDIAKLNKEDPMVRKMIMEVIFGPNAAPSIMADGKLNPPRVRNCVKALDKDFVYDMDIVDTQIRNQVAIENKVKPIKIIKNNECDFKVINLSPSHQKKKKCC